MTEYLDIIFNTPVYGVFTYLPLEGIECSAGYRVVAPFKNRSLTGYVLKRHTDTPKGNFRLKTIERVIDKTPLFDIEQIRLASWVSGMYMCTVGEALASMLPGARRESRISIPDDYIENKSTNYNLAPQQIAAVKGITAKADGYSYLFGVTGSGKTEVFLTIAEHTINEKKGVIYLVPEISLTHQLTIVVKNRFKNKVAVLHSGLTRSQRFVEWMRIKNGEAVIVIGARSAVFAPVKRLGLIIIDEEHEAAYKSGFTPRYHARQVAMHRCSIAGARLVMGSATPSAEAYLLMNNGRISKYNLPLRLSGGSMPEIKIVDMKKETGSLSKCLTDEIRKTHDEGRQTILFLNRRGFSYFFHCRTCGYELKCKNCSVSLTFHRARNKMVCHYCGYTCNPLDVCPECGSLDVGYSGFGTELVEKEVKEKFPDMRISRIDTDSVRKRGVLKSIIDDFYSGKIDILLGTQMVAKGLNFPGVKLVGIILADTGLHLPDFRAAERTFSLLVQVSGRAGRYISDGKVVIQTYRPENEVIKLAAEGSLDNFYNNELKARKMLAFPPYSRILRFVFRGKNRDAIRKASDKFAKQISERCVKTAEILGPAECPISAIAGNYRYHIIIRTNYFNKVHSVLSKIVKDFSAERSVYIEVDVDPVNLL